MRGKLLKPIILVAAIAAGAAALSAAPPKLSPRARVLASKALTAPADSTVQAYIMVDGESLDRRRLEQIGVSVTLETPTIMTARIPVSALNEIGDVPGVEYVQTALPARQMLDISRAETGAEAVQSGIRLPQAYTGKGVIVGVVDCGFDYSHRTFYDADKHLRISRVWEQATEPKDGMPSPEAFGYGAELTTPEQIETAGGDIRNNSHGTHVTSIAAGSDTYMDGALRGMAPDAEIVLVSMPYGGENNVNITNAIAYIFNYAESVGKPAVVNLSLGTFSGPHDGTSFFDTMADRLQGPGRLIVGASGNYRAESFHLRRDFSGEDSVPVRTLIDYKNGISSAKIGSEIEIWAELDAAKEIALMAWKISTNQQAERVVIYPTETDNEQVVTLGRNISGDFTVTSEISPLNGKLHIVVTSNVKSIRTDYGVALEVVPGRGAIDVWADASVLGLTAKGLDGFVQPDGESTVCEIGGTARRILTVGAYTTRRDYRVLGETADKQMNETLGDLCSFSSCGPTADGRIKPQVTAPGCYISAAVSNNDASGTIVRSQCDMAAERNYQYGYMQGTSMACPHVAGIVATWLQAYPELTPEELDEIVRTTARRDNLTSDVAAGSNLWGYGKIDAVAGISRCIELAAMESVSGIVADDKCAASVTHCSNGRIGLLFLADAMDVDVTLYDIAGRRVALHELGPRQAGSTVELDANGLSGIYILNVATPTSSRSCKIRL